MTGLDEVFYYKFHVFNWSRYIIM